LFIGGVAPVGVFWNTAPLSPEREGVMTTEQSRSERVGLADVGLALMALAAGSTDAMAFLKLGTVFTSAMTGNTVLLCIAIGEGRISAALQSFAALASFVVGAMLATMVDRRRAEHEGVPLSLLPLFNLEIACLGGFVAVWFAFGHATEGATYALIALSALAMGVQGVTARQINVPQVNTIVFTTTIISVVVSVTHALLRSPGRVPFDTKRQIGILLVYAIGAALAGFSIHREIAVYVWIPLVAVIAAFACYELGGRSTARPA
jgi:uncharacterized membrane protein YoaK (UPF0700 family)